MPCGTEATAAIEPVVVAAAIVAVTVPRIRKGATAAAAAVVPIIVVINAMALAAVHTVETYHARNFRHNEMMRRIGKGGQVSTNERLCSNHQTELVRQSIRFK